MKFWSFLLCAAGLAIASPPAFATEPIIDWDPAFYWQPGATFDNAPAGGVLQIVGIVSDFGPPLDFLNAQDPTREYTFYINGLFSNGTTPNGPPATTIYHTLYSGGTIEIYEDLSPDASFDPNPPNAGVPADFQDGTLLLSGFFGFGDEAQAPAGLANFFTETNNFTAFQTGNSDGDITWTGGTLIGHLSPGGGPPCPGLLTGALTWRPSLLIPGYLFRHDGKIDHNCPSPARKSTWGSIKSLYR